MTLLNTTVSQKLRTEAMRKFESFREQVVKYKLLAFNLAQRAFSL